MEREIEKTYTCPFCGKKALYIAVHDDEGNYHGRLGCEYEHDPWSGLSYALHHEGWGECILCTGGADGVMGGILFDTTGEAAEAMPTLTQPNEPLTLEELKGMDGPVWAACKPIEGGDDWCLCRHGTIITPAASVYDVGEISHWVFYRRPPEVSP